MKTVFVLQTTFISLDKSYKVFNALKNHNIDVIEGVVVPFVEKFQNEEEILNLHNQGYFLIPYGSCLMVKKSVDLNLKGVSFNENFNYNSWNLNRDDMLNKDAINLKISEAECYLFNSPQELFFIRPLNDLKDFTGGVFSKDELLENIKNKQFGNSTLTENNEVIISAPKNIKSEMRFFVIDGKIISGSYYRINGQFKTKEITDSDLLQKAQDKANIWLPHECCVMDLAETDDGLKCVEFNSINASGFYDCNIENIVLSLNNWGNKNIIKNSNKIKL